MDGCHQFVGFDGDDGRRADGASIGRAPFVPETREGEGLAGFEKDEVRDFGFRPGLGLPLVEAVGQDETAFVFETAAEGGFFGQRLAARIDEALSDGQVFGPRGDETPDEEVGFVPRIVGDGEDGLRGSNVEARREFGGECVICKCFLQVGGVNG